MSRFHEVSPSSDRLALLWRHKTKPRLSEPQTDRFRCLTGPPPYNAAMTAPEPSRREMILDCGHRPLPDPRVPRRRYRRNRRRRRASPDQVYIATSRTNTPLLVAMSERVVDRLLVHNERVRSGGNRRHCGARAPRSHPGVLRARLARASLGLRSGRAQPSRSRPVPDSAKAIRVRTGWVDFLAILAPTADPDDLARW